MPSSSPPQHTRRRRWLQPRLFGRASSFWPRDWWEHWPSTSLLPSRVKSSNSGCSHTRRSRQAEVQIARQTAQALLGSGGIQTEWRQWVGNDGCAQSPAGRPFVRVHLLPITKMSDPSASGDAIHTSPGPMSALVYVPGCGNRSGAAPKSRGPRESIVVWADDGACRRRHDRARGRPPAGAFLQVGRRDETATERG